MTLIEELKRRRVVRVALVYLAASFAVLQAADILVPALHLPAWTMTLLVVLLAVGCMVALVLAWVLERTPAGIRVTGPASDGMEAAPALIGRRTVLAAGGLVLMGVAFGAGWVARPGTPDPDRRTGVISVAVLPFTDQSPDRSQEYLGDGVAEELINTLVRSEDIVVASRSSSFSYRGRNAPIPVIARELDVNHVIEGSVGRSGDRIRVRAQLVDVRADRPLWSESFDRPAHDIFAVQDEIAAAIARALRVRLALPDRPVSGTTDAEAYDLFLLGLYHWNKRTPEGLTRALEVFTAATERDPSYARAWAGLSLTYRNLPGYTDYDADLARVQARRTAERAVALDPNSAEARTALGGALWFVDERDAAERELERAIALDPSFATAHHWLGILQTNRGRFAEGEATLRRALALDPASLPIQSYLGLNLEMQGRIPEALAEAEALLVRAPDYRNGLIQAFLYGTHLGRAREFEPRLAGYFTAIGQNPAYARFVVDGIESPAQRARAVAVLDTIASRTSGAGREEYLAALYALLGAADRALHMVERGGLVNTPLQHRWFDLLKDDPRFQALVSSRRHDQEPRR